jgi:hypothetical protein
MRESIKKTILFPCHPLNTKEVYPDFLNEYNVARLVGFDIMLIDLDKLDDDNEVVIRGLSEPQPSSLDIMRESYPIIYRGWMLSDDRYEHLYNFLKGNDYYLITPPENYNICHYFPYVYEFIEEHTPKAVWMTDLSELESKARSLGTDMIMKDFVKSDKGLEGINRINKKIFAAELKSMAEDFIIKRGKLFNKGIVLKEFVELKKYEGEVNEFRSFVISVGPLVNAIVTNRNSNIKGEVNTPPPEWIRDIADNIPSAFFTIDVAEKEDGSWIVIETGDGQVSGLSPGQNPIDIFNYLSVVY